MSRHRDELAGLPMFEDSNEGLGEVDGSVLSGDVDIAIGVDDEREADSEVTPEESEIISGISMSARHTDPGTSHDRMKAIELSGRMEEVYADMKANGPSTSLEVAERTGIPHTVTSTTMSKLNKAGLIRKTGEIRNRSQVQEVVA